MTVLRKFFAPNYGCKEYCVLDSSDFESQTLGSKDIERRRHKTGPKSSQYSLRLSVLRTGDLREN